MVTCLIVPGCGSVSKKDPDSFLSAVQENNKAHCHLKSAVQNMHETHV